MERSGGAKGKNLRHEELTYHVIGCAQRVHADLGPGFPEAVYHRALSLELAHAELPFENEKILDVHYSGVCCGQFKADLVIDKKVIVELKALSSLNNDHLAQILAYLKASSLSVGLLINFGCKSLETKRVVM